MIKTKYKFLLLLFLCCSHSYQGFAQQYNFKNYGTKQGLVGSNINCIFPDKEGYIWFGAQDGVSRFDGKTFKSFTTNDGLIDNDVTCITGDKSGNIWIGTTSAGVSKYDGIKFKNFTKKEGLGNEYIHSIFVDDKNTIWIATDAGVWNITNEKIVSKFTKADAMLSETVYAVTQDKKGDYWFATYYGINKYDGKKIINFNGQGNIKNKQFFSVMCDTKGNTWFGGPAKNGIIKYNGVKFERLTVPKQISKEDRIYSIMEDARGNTWFSTDNSGIIKYDKGNFTLFDEANGLSSNSVFALATDYEGNIWTGNFNGGVDFFNNESFTNYTDKQGLSSNKITYIHKSEKGKLIVGTLGSGLNYYDGNSFKTIKGLKELSNEKILAISENKQHEIWVGTEMRGIYILDGNSKELTIKKHITKFNDVTLGAVSKIVFDRNGNTWISTFGTGLFTINKTGVKNYNTSNGFASDNLLTMMEDSNNNIWLGTYDAGVLKYDGEKFSAYSEKQGLANKSVWSIAEDNNQHIYFGTVAGGLSCFDGKNFKTISTKQGLCSNYIETLLWDTIAQCLWAGTDKGINKIKLNPDFQIQSLRYYGEQEGFKGMEVNQNALYMDDEGLIWFGTINGLCRYNRKFDFPNTTAPKLILADIQLAYKDVTWKNYTDSVDSKTNIPQRLVLSHKDNHLTFHFQALTTDNVKYKYILKGQDTAWSPLLAGTEANYSNIAPGKNYVFKVKALNSGGIESNEISFAFTIKPPWWQTWWFYTIAAFVVTMSFYSFVRFRTARLATEKKMLEEKVTERTLDLKVANNKLSVAFKDIKDSIEYAKRIQFAILPQSKTVGEYLSSHFIVYMPKDIVAGDFYWIEKIDDLVLFAACDCTGHGVPGAMVSVVCHNALNRAVREFGLRVPAEILDKTAELVISNFSKSEDEIKDGMDISLCSYNTKTKILSWAGANNPLWLMQNGEVTETKADKQSIGMNEQIIPFTNHQFQLNTNDSIYIFSDGYADQFDNENKKKLTKRKFRELIQSVMNRPMSEQGKELEKFILDYRGETEQTDDILVIGIKVS